MVPWTAGRTHTIAAVVILVLTGLLVRDVRQEAPVTIDEPGWISSGAVTFDLVRRRAPVSEWEHAYDRLQLGDWGTQNPPVAKFYFGAILALTGHGDPVAYRWAFPRTYAQNLAAGTLPPAAVITPVRLGVVLTAAITLGLTYLLAFALVGNVAAVLAPLVLFALPVFRFHATHVYTDVPELACVLLGAVLCCAYARRQRWTLLIGAGLAGGLACAIKFNAAPIVAAAVLIVWWYSSRQRIARAAAVAAIPLIVFVAVNPYLYPAPIARTRAIIQTWSARKVQQQQDPHLAAGVRALARRGPAVGPTARPRPAARHAAVQSARAARMVPRAALGRRAPRPAAHAPAPGRLGRPVPDAWGADGLVVTARLGAVLSARGDLDAAARLGRRRRRGAPGYFPVMRAMRSAASSRICSRRVVTLNAWTRCVARTSAAFWSV